MAASCWCVACKPCNGHCLPGLFKSRRRHPAQQLRRALGKMKQTVGGRRRRRAGSFSSVRAVFWPLMSMRSEADARTDDTAVASDDTRVPSAAAATAPPGSEASTTAARVLALQARLGDREAARAGPAAKASATSGVVSLISVVRPAARVEQVARGGSVVVRPGDDLDDGVEAACRSFERHLMEMLVEEREVADLTDVEELLCCWEKLRCPAFVQLVGRFYGELCMDLFSSSGRDADVLSSGACQRI